MFRKILIVCVGNICRSPMGEALFKDHIKKNHISVTVSSAGIGALVGKPVDPIVQEILNNKGIDSSEHRARQLTESLLLDSDLVLVMEKNHRAEIERIYPTACGKVHLLGKWGNFEIPDPYKKSKQYFENTYDLIAKGIVEWKTKLWK